MRSPKKLSGRHQPARPRNRLLKGAARRSHRNNGVPEPPRCLLSAKSWPGASSPTFWHQSRSFGAADRFLHPIVEISGNGDHSIGNQLHVEALVGASPK